VLEDLCSAGAAEYEVDHATIASRALARGELLDEGQQRGLDLCDLVGLLGVGLQVGQALRKTAPIVSPRSRRTTSRPLPRWA
jgi:hypothetical protein